MGRSVAVLIQKFLREKGYILDLILLACLVFFLIFWGWNFAVKFFTLLAATFIILRRIDYEKHIWLKRGLLVVFGIGAVSFIIIEALVFTQLGSKEEERADYVIILGSGIKGTELSLTLKQRLDASLDYIRTHPQTPVIVSGGQGPGESISEALAMKNYLVDQGIAPAQIIMEDRSTSTQENLAFSKKIILASGLEHPKIMIVTSDYHMFRSKYIAAKNGYAAEYGISAPSPGYLKPINMIREYFGTVKAFL
ncbi:YdcF family protein [Paenibacillus cucumis (ex Kampfer et al. 2016)]|uniref:YdcF family protein n=1 Tax=Paenibacillus cucumis (ex Kampfer et al. 2016) TaxID=1776858 RepID=UPI001C8DF7F6|nr:YdcF family protein [Paenibacillus cucumis (ex Kampfer et al. 2016)]